MLSFFKRKGKNDSALKNDGLETAVSASDVTGEEAEAGQEEALARPQGSLSATRAREGRL